MKTPLLHSRSSLLETAVGLGCILAATLPSAHAAPLWWDGVSGGWDATANWSTVAGADNPDPAAVPGAGDDVTFNIDPVDGATVVSLNAARSVNSLVFNNTGTTLLQGGGVANQILTIGAGGISVDAAAGAVTIGSTTALQNVTTTIAATQTWHNPSANPLVVVNPIASAGALGSGAGITKTGSGTVWFSTVTNHQLNGTLDIQAGKVQVSSDLTMGGLSGAGTIENGGPASKWFFVNTPLNQNFSGTIQNGPTAARLGFVKRGTGALTLSGTNGPAMDYLGVENGRIILPVGATTSVGGISGTTVFGSVNIGNTNNTANNGVLEISGGTLNAQRTNNPGFTVGAGNNARGFVKMTGGTLNVTEQLKIGNGSAAATPAHAGFTLDAGNVTSGSWLVVGLNFDRSLLTQNGGSITVAANRMTIGAGGNGSIGVVNLNGGTFNIAAGANTGIFLGENGTGTLNVMGSAALSLATNGGATSGTMQFGGNAASLAGTLNLLGGSLSAFGVTKGNSTATAVYQVNFNGGTLKAAQSNPNFFAALPNTEAFVHAGGGTVDNNGGNITITEPLLAPTGNGVSATGLVTSGGGYLYPPIVTITGGGGTGASAIANIDGSGNLTGITITNPGVNYTSAPTFALVGGGAGNTGALSGAASLVANTSGGLTFTGSGTTTLAGANTFTGPIAVNGGKLALGGSYANAVTVAASQGLSVADPAGAIGALTVPSLNLGAGASVDLEANGTSSDKVVVTAPGGLSLGTVGINLYDSGTTNPALAGTYTLFEYNTSFSGGTAGLSVLNPRPGYSYAFNNTGSAITVTATAIDTDGDGMTDIYEVANGLDPNDATGVNGAAGNLDGDFATNLEEFIAGTGANNAASDPLNTDNDGLPDAWEVTNFGSIAAQTGAGDFDGDFDTNVFEYTNGTTANSAASFSDTDGDGLGDGWEIEYFTAIAAKDGTVDSDGDLFTDLEEYQYGSNPNDSSLSPAFAKAAHRWSFTGDLADSIGTSHATIENGPTNGANVAIVNADSVTLTGGAKANSQWVKLGSNLLPSRNTPCTIQLWATANATQNWSRIFDFHSSTAENLYMSWSVAAGLLTDRVQWNDGGGANSIIVDNTNQYALSTKYHIVMTVEPAATPGSSLVKWYSAPAYDGVTNLDLGTNRGSFTIPNSLALLNDAINALGFSPYNDNTASATYDEVRLWDGALPQWALEALHDQGPGDLSQADTDADKLPDAFEQFYFGNLAEGPGDDTDGDFSSNRDELLAGSDPDDATSSPNDSDADGLPDAWELNFFGDLDETAGGDPDGDFALNSEELSASSNPSLYTSFPDTDSDGMSDMWETFYVGNLGDNGSGDADGDSFNTLAEFVAKSVPNDPLSPGVADGDADNDGLPDRWELSWFSATTLATANGAGDADGDGATNLAEYEATSDPQAATSTPADVNGDGTPDQRVFHGFNATGTGLLDKDSEATPFTVRLGNTGTAIPSVDPKLDLDTTAGTLALTTSSSDINGQVNMAQLEAIGIPLSSLGFTGNQDFRIRAHYINLPALAGYDQIGAYVGTSSTSVTRAGAIGATYQPLGVNTNAANDSNATFGAAGGAGATGRDLTVIIERIGGVWSMSCNGTPSNPGVPPAFLDGNAALQAGVFVLDQNANKTAILESFTAVSFGSASPDADGDGMDDVWETANFGNTSRDGTLDFDTDGVNDLTEFAFNGDPTSGSSTGTLTTALLDTNGNSQKELTLTVAVRSGATFGTGAGGAQVATVGGVTYTIRGSLDLTTFTSAVSHVSSAPSGNPDYQLHTFRLDASEGLPGKGFLQAVATHP